MDTTPVTSRHLARYYLIDGDNLERAYKHHLSGYPEWEQLEHAGDWMLLPDNIGENLSIDETSLQDDLFTFLSNKDGHCRQGTIIAAAFPNATIVLDCFHVIKRCNDAIEEMRLKAKREAQADNRREERKFRKRKKRSEYHRKWYRKTHPKTYEGKVRGRKPARKNEKYKPQVLGNGDTVIELLTRTKRSLTQSPEKWSEKQEERMKLLFERYPKIKDSYWLVNQLRSVFRSKTLDKESAKPKFEEWYKAVNACSSREVKAARNTIKPGRTMR